MNKMKKFVSLALVLILVLSLSVSAFAATITVTGQPGETYNAYRIFDVTKNDSNGYAYSISSTSPWYAVVNGFEGLTLTATTNAAVFNVSTASTFDAAAFAAKLIENKADKTIDGTANAAEDGSATLTVADAGYYLVDSSVGALCILNTATDNVDVTEKNAYPTLTKTADKTAAAIGDTVTYTITVKDGAGTDQAITVHDTMEAGLTLNKNFAITVDGTAVAADKYAITYPATGNTFEIAFNEGYITSLNTGAEIVITYSALLNKDAEISTETNDNTAWLTYAALTSTPATVAVSTYQFDLDKTDKDGVPLTGAEFKLYDALTGGKEIALVKDGAFYRPALAGETGEVIAAGTASIKGLDGKTYYLEETKAPAGYNLLTARLPVDLSTGNKLRTTAEGVTTYGVQVVNLTGSQLPETGGIGTTIFYILGGLLAVGAVVVLVTRKRVHDTEA